MYFDCEECQSYHILKSGEPKRCPLEGMTEEEKKAYWEGVFRAERDAERRALGLV